MRRFISVLLATILTVGLISISPNAMIKAAEASTLAIDFEDDGLRGFYGDRCTLNVTNQQAHSGNKCMLLTSRQTKYAGARIPIKQYVETNVYYEVTAWVKSKKDNNYIFIETNFGADRNNTSGEFIIGKTVSKADGWVKLSGQVGYNDTNFLNHVEIVISSSDGIDFYIDDFSIKNTNKKMNLSGIKTISLLPSLNKIYKNYFPIGNYDVLLFDLPHAPDEYAVPIMQRHFSVLSIGMDSFAVTSAKGSYNFTNKDRDVKRIREAGFSVNAGTLLGFQDAKWLTNNPNGTPLTRTEAIKNLTEHINTVAGHYAGKIHSWIVVNEAMAPGAPDSNNLSGANWRNALRKDNPWYDAFSNGANASKKENGADFIEKAFRLARKADPDAILVYNETGMESLSYKFEATVNMVKEINDKWRAEGNTRPLIEVVGIQGHIDIYTSPADVEKIIKRFIDLGVNVSITELDISIRKSGDNNDAAFAKQSELYAKLFKIFKKYSKNITDVTLWGLVDESGDSHSAGKYPQLFDENYNPKLAFFAVADPEGFLAGNFDTEKKRNAWIRANSK